MDAINLIPMHRRQAQRRRRRIRFWSAIGCGYVVLLVAASIGAHVVWGHADRQVGRKLSDVRGQVQQTRSKIEKLHPQLAEANMQLKASRAVAVQPDWSVLLALLADKRGQRITLTKCVLSPTDPPRRKQANGSDAQAPGPDNPPPGQKGQSDRPDREAMHFRIEIAGLGESQQAVSRFVLRLERTGLFNRVRLLETGRAEFNGRPVVSFRLDCTIHEQRKGRSDDGTPQTASAGANQP